MPTQAPRFRPPGWKERTAWQPAEGYKDKRKRGRAGMRDRAAVMAEEPFCRLCLAQDKRVKSDVVDHRRPLAHGGSDARSNKQALCTPCHDAKSAAERADARRSANRSRP